MFISVSVVFGIWSITQDWCESWFMTTAVLIPLHTQTFINELLLEEREPSVSVKHTWVFLMSSLNTHSRLSVSSGHRLTQIQTSTHSQSAPESCYCSTVGGENVLTSETVTLAITLSQLQENKKHSPLLRGHYSPLLLGLNGSLSEFDIWWIEMSSDWLSLLLQALIQAPRGL